MGSSAAASATGSLPAERRRLGGGLVGGGLRRLGRGLGHGFAGDRLGRRWAGLVGDRLGRGGGGRGRCDGGPDGGRGLRPLRLLRLGRLRRALVGRDGRREALEDRVELGRVGDGEGDGAPGQVRLERAEVGVGLGAGQVDRPAVVGEGDDPQPRGEGGRDDGVEGGVVAVAPQPDVGAAGAERELERVGHQRPRCSSRTSRTARPASNPRR